MATPSSILDANGTWKGRSQLHLSWLEPHLREIESDSTLHVEATEAYATIGYTWAYQGEPQTGAMHIAKASDVNHVEIGWVDSWHQSGGVLHLIGAEEGNGIKAGGTYTAGDETWGWTIALDVTGDELTITMENVEPSGNAEWAVRGVYGRA